MRLTFSLPTGEVSLAFIGTQQGFADIPAQDLYNVEAPGSHFNGTTVAFPVECPVRAMREKIELKLAA